MDKLTREEVLHVANLARLNLDEEEIEKFSYQLKELFNAINKINEIDLETNEIFISPCEILCKEEKDVYTSIDIKDKAIENAPNKFDNFIEVRGVFDE